MITLEKQIGTQRCGVCGVHVRTVHGSVLDNGRPFGRYFVALHGHSGQGRVAQVALALLDRRKPEAIPVSVALDAEATARELRLNVVDWDQSPWAQEGGLGTLLDRGEVVDNPLRPLVLQMADQVLRELDDVQSYFAAGLP